MSYIREVAVEEAAGRTREVYTRMVGVRGGTPSAVMSVMSLHPEGMEAVFELTHVVAHGGSTLGRRHEEMLATMVSRLNRCEY